jgi:8-oxo-dGTP diphosphatase
MQPSASVTVDIAVLTIHHGRLSILLVRRAAAPFAGDWALPGGFVGEDEDLDGAATRELCEETGVDLTALDAMPGHVEQLRSYGAPGRDPRGRVVSVAYLAMMPKASTVEAGSDAADARFWAVDDLAGDGAPRLAFDHAVIVADAVERARAKLEYTPLATSFMEEPFTLGDLRRIYEAVWGVDLPAARFRRQVLSTQGFVTPEGGELYRRGPAAVLHPAFLRAIATAPAVNRDSDL